MVNECTIKCPICGRPYKFSPFLDKDQSACPQCVEEAEKNMTTRIKGWGK
jgi:uncharacterized protein (DUF983 family)